MNSGTNLRITLNARPHGQPTADNFTLERSVIPEVGTNEVLVKNHYLSLDPYMRGRMNDAPSYTPPIGIGEVMTGGTVGQVVSSQLAGFSEGDFVVGYGGWQEYSVFVAGEARKLDATVAPVSTPIAGCVRLHNRKPVRRWWSLRPQVRWALWWDK